MTLPTPSSSSTSYGNLVEAFPPRTVNRIVIIALAILCVFIALTGNLLDVTLDTFPRLIFAALAVACLVQLYYQRGANAQVFEHGFVVSRAGNTVSGRWEDIANVTHKAYRRYLYGFIPLPGTVDHTYIIILRNGQQMPIHAAYYTNGNQLGAIIERMWVAKRNPGAP
jgi:hypothetical protein